jgi:hypothetical protein
MPAAAAYQWKSRAARAHPAHAKSASAVKITQFAVSTTPIVQARLRIGAPNDRFEQEADRVAEGVMQMGEPGNRMAPGPGVSRTSSALQEKCASCSSGGGLCPDCAEEEKLRRQPLDSAAATWGARRAVSADPVIVSPMLHEVLNSPGRPLDLGARNLMESCFRYDFSKVRVHSDQRAAESAHDLHALAYTVGRDVVFGAGQYSPFTDPGKKLLAHELTHVVQQGDGSFSSGTVLPVGAGPRHPLEHRAEAVNHTPVGTVSSVSMAHSNPFLQRAVTEQGTRRIGLPTPRDQRCAGWFADHESLSKRAAEHYVQTELTGNRGKGEKINCDLFVPASGVFACTVQFTDGTRIRVLVRKDVIIVGVDPIKSLRPPPDQPLCWYDYSCPGPRRDLVLTRRKCQSAKRASGSKP